MKDEIKFDFIVICSTLNQMVNYIAIKEHEIKNIYSITMSTEEQRYKCDNSELSNKFSYELWDKNLCDVLDRGYTIDYIEYDKDEVSCHENIIGKLCEKIPGNKPEKILWNITGGQRHFVMAITEYVYKYRPNDVIVYFEGDNEHMYYYSKSKTEDVRNEYMHINSDTKISIPLALKLMGFKLGNEHSYYNTSKYYKFLVSEGNKEFENICEKNDISFEKIHKEYEWYKKFYSIYRKSKYLRQLLINSNRFHNKKDENKEIIETTILDQIIEEIKKSKERIKYDNAVNDIFNEEGIEILRSSLGEHDKGKVFGYILERMTLYRIIHNLKENPDLKEKVADIDISVKGIDEDTSDKVTDEFDILMVTKKGKVMMFECKSGGMNGDNAKSHNYSTYAIAGVYGTPILVCPIITDEFNNIKSKQEFSSKSDHSLSETKDLYKNIRGAINSAIKARLDIWKIDDDKKLKELLK